MPSIHRIAERPQLPGHSGLALPEQYRDLIRRDPRFGSKASTPLAATARERTLTGAQLDSAGSAHTRFALVARALTLSGYAAAFLVGVALGGAAATVGAVGSRPAPSREEILLEQVREIAATVDRQKTELAGAEDQLTAFTTAVEQLRQDLEYFDTRLPRPSSFPESVRPGRLQ